jgi:hypothetical protein
MNSPTLNSLNALAASPSSSAGRSSGQEPASSWFEAMAKAWGETLDRQAERITELSDQIGPQGNDKPSVVAELTAESLRLSFMANAEHTSLDSVGKALETMARKS